MDEDISIENKEIYLFGSFRVDATERLLFKNNSLVQLSGNTFDLLLALVRSPGHLKSRRELIRTVWPDTIVEESNLTWNVTALRQALGDDRHAPRYIETVRGHGYRFIAPVKVEPQREPKDLGRESENIETASAATDSATQHPTQDGIATEVAPMGQALARRHAVLIAAGGVAVLVVALALTWYFAFYRPAPMAAPGPSIAVLPFENLSPGHADAWFAAGIQDTILSRLSGIGRLRVTSRTSSERYPSRPTNLRRVAAQLGVSSVLEGSVQKVGNQVLINVQLIDTRNNDHIWGQSYTRPVTDLFAVENNIATQVISALQAKLLPHEAARLSKAPTHNPRAYLLYLKANYYANQVLDSSSAENSAAAVTQAVKLYHQAIAQDPRFALAWARLSLLESLTYNFGIAHTPQTIADAEHAVKKALALKPNLPEAHLAKGYVEYYGHKNYTAALSAFEHINQHVRHNTPGIIGATAFVHRRQGKWQEALAGLWRAAQLDPRNPLWYYDIGVTQMVLRQYTQSEQQFDRALALGPQDYNALAFKVITLLLAGKPLEQIRTTLEDIPNNSSQKGLVATLHFELARLSHRPEAALDALKAAPDWVEATNAVGLEPTALLRAEAWAAQNDRSRARRAYKKARDMLQKALHNQPKNAKLWSFLGLAEVGLGQKSKAIHACRKAASLVPVSKDAMYGPSHLVTLAKIYARTGKNKQAIKLLRQLLTMPAGLWISVPLLERDPVWDPLRKEPAFQTLLEKYGHKSP